MNSTRLWETLSDALELCQTGQVWLTQSIHFDLETHVPPGTLAFEAVLMLIERFPPELQSQALAVAEERLAGAPVFARRELASDYTLPRLAESVGWPLISSLSYRAKQGGTALAQIGARSAAGLTHVGLLCKRLELPALATLVEMARTGSLRSFEWWSSGQENNISRHLIDNGVFSNAVTLWGLTEADLEGLGIFHAKSTTFTCTPRTIHLLEHHAPALEELSLFSCDEDQTAAIEALLKSKHLLSRLKSLKLSMDCSEEQFARLIASPYLGRLESLQIKRALKDGSVSSHAIEAFHQAAFLDSLRTLVLDREPLTTTGYQALARVPFKSLQKLDLESTQGGSEGLEAIAAAPWLSKVCWLSLANNQFGEQAIKALVTATGAQNLEYLDLAGNWLEEGGVDAFADPTILPNLRQFHVNGASLDGVEALARCPWFTNLEQIWLRTDVATEDEDALLLLSPGTYPRLRALCLSGEVIDRGIQAFADSFVAPRLRSLRLDGLGMTDHGVEMLSHSRLLNNLWELEIPGWSASDDGTLRLVSDDGVLALAASDQIHQLIKLKLWMWKLTARGSRALAEADWAPSLRWFLPSDKEVAEPWLKSSKVNPLLRARIEEWCSDSSP